jgi:hypothetical protein
MKFKYIVIVLSLVGLSVLYLVSSLSQPTAITLSEVPFNEGKQVMVTGVVTMYQPTTSGSQLITLREVNGTDSSTITVYVEGAALIEYGDVVRVIGTIQQYNEQWEITVSSPRFIEVLQPWGNRSCPLWQLAENPMKYVETNVNVTGVVGSLSNIGFTLSDADGAYLIPVSCNKSVKTSLSLGEDVAVRARFVYNAATLCYLLKVMDDTHGIIVVGRGSDA